MIDNGVFVNKICIYGYDFESFVFNSVGGFVLSIWSVKLYLKVFFEVERVIWVIVLIGGFVCKSMIVLVSKSFV